MNADFAKALIQAQQEMPAIEKTGKNPHFRSEFVTLDHLLAKALPVLNRNGIAVVQAPTMAAETGMPILSTVLVHESGETLSFEMALFLAKNEPQGHGAAITYAKRQALSAALGISDEKDDDAESTRGVEASAGGHGVAASSPGSDASSPSPPSAGSGTTPPPAEETPEQRRERITAAWDSAQLARLKESIPTIDDADLLRELLVIESERPKREKGEPRKTVLTMISARIRKLEPGPEALEGEPTAADAPGRPADAPGRPAAVAQENEPPPVEEGEKHPPAGQSFDPASPSEPPTTNGTAVLRLKAALAFIQDQPASVENAPAWTVSGVLLGLSQRGVVASSLEEVPDDALEMVWGAIPDQVKTFVDGYGPEALAAEAAKAK